MGGSSLVSDLASVGRALVVSRGYNLATAMQTALKLQETARVFALGLSGAGFQHGPIALTWFGAPIIAFVPPGKAGQSVIDTIGMIGDQRHVWSVGLGVDPTRAPRNLALRVEQSHDAITPLILGVPGLLLAEHVSRAAGLDPDRPAGLRKVTRTL